MPSASPSLAAEPSPALAPDAPLPDLFLDKNDACMRVPCPRHGNNEYCLFDPQARRILYKIQVPG